MRPKPPKPSGRLRPTMQLRFETLRLCAQQLSGRQRPTAWLQFEMLRTCVQQLTGRWRPLVQIAPTPYNNHMVRVYRSQIGREAIEEEGQDHQSFLTACGTVLQACPPEACGVLMYPLQLLMGNMSFAALLALSPQLSTTVEEPAPATPHPTMSAAPTPSWESNSDTTHPGRGQLVPPLLLKNPLFRSGKKGGSSQGSKKTARRPFIKIPIWSRPPGSHTLKHTALPLTRRDLRTSPVFFRRWSSLPTC